MLPSSGEIFVSFSNSLVLLSHHISFTTVEVYYISQQTVLSKPGETLFEWYFAGGLTVVCFYLLTGLGLD